MTFDEGPSFNIPTLLETLRKAKVKVTFHFVPELLRDKKLQDILRKVVAAGHEVGIRTSSSLKLSDMGGKEIQDIIKNSAAVLKKIAKVNVKFVRLPYGTSDPKVIDAVTSAGFIVTEANIDSLDFNSSKADIIDSFELAMNTVSSGKGKFISVQRDMVTNSVNATGDIIALIKKKGYTLVRLSECVGIKGVAVVKKGSSNGASGGSGAGSKKKKCANKKDGGIANKSSSAAGISSFKFTSVMAVLSIVVLIA